MFGDDGPDYDNERTWDQQQQAVNSITRCTRCSTILSRNVSAPCVSSDSPKCPVGFSNFLISYLVHAYGPSGSASVMVSTYIFMICAMKVFMFLRKKEPLAPSCQERHQGVARGDVKLPRVRDQQNNQKRRSVPYFLIEIRHRNSGVNAQTVRVRTNGAF